MARPKQDGLKYFSFDTDFFYADKRIKRLRSRYGSDGLIFYIYLLTEIYRNGYYIRWDEDSIDDAIDDLNLTEGLIEQVMTFLVGRSLLNRSTLANSDTIITSPGIQKRYQEAVKSLKREVVVEADIWLLGKEETASFIKVIHNSVFSEKNENKSEKNESKSEINHTKEIKENESILNKTKEDMVCPEPENPASEPPVMTIILNTKEEFPFYQSDIDQYSELYPAVDVLQEFRKMKGWCMDNPSRRKTKRGIRKFVNSWLSRAQDRSGGYRGQSGGQAGNNFKLEDWGND